MKENSVIIKVAFSPKLELALAKARAQGEKITLDSFLATLVKTYQTEIQKNEHFRRPLKAIDPDVQISVFRTVQEIK